MNYFICGFTGAGKSYALKQIENSHQLSHYSFFDLDMVIDQEYAEHYHSLADLIDNIGFDAFREIELQKIIDFEHKPNIFLALGGGTINERTIEILNKGWHGFWLNTDFELCLERIKDDPNRPLSRKSSHELRDLYNQRLSFYRQFQEVGTVEQILNFVKG